MSAIELIALASTVSLLAGWRLYLVTFAVGLAMKLGWVALPDQLHTLDVLANNWIIGIAGAGALAEFFADKIACGQQSLGCRPFGRPGRSAERCCRWRSSMAVIRPGRSEASFSAVARRLCSRMPPTASARAIVNAES